MSQRARACGWLLILIAAASTLTWQLATAPARTVRGIAQERWTHATPPIGPDHAIGQSFFAPKDGLQAVEVLAARYRPDEQLPADAQWRVVWECPDSPEQASLTTYVSIARVQNNQRVRLPVPAELDCPARQYRFTLHSVQDHGVGVWASQTEALAGGEQYANGAPIDGDLVVSTYHAYPLSSLLRDLPDILTPWLGALGVAALLLALPGLALLHWAPPHRPMNAMLCAAWLMALGLAFWPLLLLWTTTVGLPMTANMARGVLVALGIMAVAGYLHKRRSGRHLRLAPLGWPEMTLIAILALALIVRLVQARNQIVPVWVDSVHHTLVTQLIAEQGLVPRTGEPYISIAGFHYHFGFHANAAVLTWLAALPPYRSVLGFGQILTGLAGLPVFALTVHALSGRRTVPPLAARWAGVIAAAVPAFVTYMPAYYLSWGRYTQLAGLLILPVLLAQTLDLLRQPRLTPGRWLVTLLLIAGLALTHYRVLTFYAVFWLVYGGAMLAMGLWRHVSRRTGEAGTSLGEGLRPDTRTMVLGLALAAGSLLLIAPWVVRMVTAALLPFGAIYGQWAAPEGVETSLPMGLLRAEGTMRWVAVAGLGWLWALARRRWHLVLLGAWVAACVLLSDLSWLGLRGTWFIHGTSAAISYWLPAGLFIGWLASDLALGPIHWIHRAAHKRGGAVALSAVLTFGLTVASISSAWGQVDRVNEATVLLRETDLPAIEWVGDNLPQDSLILINTRPWMSDMRMGSDAGWWLPYLTGHRVTFPALLYTHGEPSYRDPIAQLAQAVDTTESLDDAALLRLLAEAGVTHLFVGTRGGPLEPQNLTGPSYVELYRHGPTRVYSFDPP